MKLYCNLFVVRQTLEHVERKPRRKVKDLYLISSLRSQTSPKIGENEQPTGRMGLRSGSGIREVPKGQHKITLLSMAQPPHIL